MTKPPASSTPPGPRVELIPITDLHPHPRNYRTHPPDQLEHLKQSLLEHGLYRNVVVARDNTLLAGHGVWLAATLLDWTHLEVRRVDLDPDHPRTMSYGYDYTRLAGAHEHDPHGVIITHGSRIVARVATTRAARRLIAQQTIRRREAIRQIAALLSQHTATREASRAALLASVNDVRATVEQRLRDLGAE